MGRALLRIDRTLSRMGRALLRIDRTLLRMGRALLRIDRAFTDILVSFADGSV